MAEEKKPKQRKKVVEPDTKDTISAAEGKDCRRRSRQDSIADESSRTCPTQATDEVDENTEASEKEQVAVAAPGEESTPKGRCYYVIPSAARNLALIPPPQYRARFSLRSE